VVSAQINHPKASPFSRIEQEVGLTTITVEYSRPAVRGRKIFGDLVPFGRIWRVGANESTKINSNSEIDVKGHTLPKGTYALYAFPDKETWQIVFHKNIAHWGDGRKAYDPKDDAFRITIVPENIPYFQENFLISFEAIDHNSSQMLWTWENTKVSIPITVPTEGLMMKEIEQKIKGEPTAQTYYEAARYLQEQGREPLKALEYLNKAIALEGDTYYFHRIKSLVEAALGKYEAAIASAEKSLKLAEEDEKDEFVRMNEKNILVWKQFSKGKKDE
jgi:tetratricopeptide (TPR) repeat protein